MSYKIFYGQPPGTAKQRANIRILPIMAGIMLAFAIFARICYPAETKQLTEALFPLTSASSQEALDVFTQNIKAGESLGDAVAAFCLEILNETDSN